MKKKILVSMLAIIMIMMLIPVIAMTASAEDGDACVSKDSCAGTYVNGFYNVCDGYQPAQQVDDTHYAEINATHNGYYAIENAGQLYWLIDQSNYDAMWSGYNVVLTSDIVVNENVLTKNADTGRYTLSGDAASLRKWILSDRSFEGILDGNGHCISGLYASYSNRERVGLFSTLTGVIKDLEIKDSCLKGKSYVGGFCGYNAGEIVGCSAEALISDAYYTDNYNGYLGGIAGYNVRIVDDCVNKGTVDGTYNTNYFGGICGFNNSTVRNCQNEGIVDGIEYIGGIVGKSYGASSVVENCANNGSIIGRISTGGIAGSSDGAVTSCVNLEGGTVSVSASAKSTDIGGIVGYAGGSIRNSYNFASVTGVTNVGGIAGRSSGDVEGCINYGTLTTANASILGSSGAINIGGVVGTCNGNITNCGNIGNLHLDDGWNPDYMGGIAGTLSGSVSNSFHVGTMSGGRYSDYAGGITGSIGGGITVENSYYSAESLMNIDCHITQKGTSKALAAFSTGEVTYLLNGSTSNGDLSWGQLLAGESVDKYPVLATEHNKVYYGYISCAVAAEMVYTNDEDAIQEKPEHTEGTAATCVEQTICAVCSESYGEPNANNHRYDPSTGKCLVCDEKLVAKITEKDGTVTYYTDFEEARRNWSIDNSSNNTLTLLEDAVYEYIELAEGRNILDLNGFTLDLGDGYIAQCSTQLTIQGGPGSKIVTKHEYCLNGSPIYISGNVQIQGGKASFFIGVDNGLFIFTSAPEHTYTVLMEEAGVFAKSADGVTLDASKFVSANVGYITTVDEDGYLSLEECVHDMADATCVTPSTCRNGCGHTEGEVNPDAHAWNEGAITTNPTCTAKGVRTFTCTHNSAHTYTEDVAIDANAHAWNEGVVSTNPTCSAVGVKTFTCTHNSAHTYTEDVAIDENAHSWNEGVVTTNPTCTAKGVKTYTCTHNSAHTYTEDVDALGHKYDNACDGDCNTCGKTRTPAEHVDADKNNACDECGESFELSGGAIAGIVIGSLLILGGGGFVVYWFVIRKKRTK